MGKVSYAVDAGEPLIPGKFYRVPCIHYPYNGRTDWWPLLGPRHADVAFLKFAHEHYHVDGRFLSAKQRRYLEEGPRSLAAVVGSAPLNSSGHPLPEPLMLNRKCWVADIPYAYHHEPGIAAIAEHFEGYQCRRSERGWICPHQQTYLGSITPIDGIITCPLHGLRICADTGRVLSRSGTMTAPISVRGNPSA